MTMISKKSHAAMKYRNRSNSRVFRKAFAVTRDAIGVGLFVSLLLLNYRHRSVFDVLDSLNKAEEVHPLQTTLKHETRGNSHSKKQLSSWQKRKIRESRKRNATKVRPHHRMSIRKSGYLVEENDFIYKGAMSSFDSAPIVDEKHKLLFFSTPKVACTTFKFLFRRIAGADNWDQQTDIATTNLPHNPKYNNLTYLWDYDMETASKMMTDPEWTRAIFVREPKRRFLSAFLDKAISNYGSHATTRCCPEAVRCRREQIQKSLPAIIRDCQQPEWDSRANKIIPYWLEDQPCCTLMKECHENINTIPAFLETIQTCEDPHWAPQSHRMESKYWKYINFVGRMENIDEDTVRLLQSIGAWEEYGQDGWGEHRNESMVGSGGGSQKHKTGSNTKIMQWFTPESERLVEEFYAEDYEISVFNFTKVNLTVREDGNLLKVDDDIYSKTHWDISPVVVEKYKLVFFAQPKVASTIWKQAFRRMEGHDDWKELWGPKELPHNPEFNGLKYLYDYPIHDAETIMTSSNWTRAIFVRNPKDRFLSVFSQMANNWRELELRCCPHRPGCSSNARSMVDFIELAKVCYSLHWIPYSDRIDEKWWKYINFIGKLETVQDDAKDLLTLIGAWEDIGATGWGENGDEPIFVKNPNAFESVHNALGKYNKKTDEMLNDFYKVDYENDFLKFDSKKVHILETNHKQ